MAITGSGTEQDPYIVHDYEELKAACWYDTNIFINLANDIDCNAYGEDFEWTNIRVRGGAIVDLQNHIIKNFRVAQGDWAFKLGDDCIIKNGKILNVYVSRSSGFCGRLSNNGNFENLSISINASAGVNNRYIIECVEMNACAIYMEGIISYDDSSALIQIKDESSRITNCDIFLNFPNNTKGNIFTGLASGVMLKNCRVRGIFNSASSAALLENGNAQDCVFDLTTNVTRFCGFNLNNNGIINTDKAPSIQTHGMTAVTSQEIINGDALRAKHFDVINVTA